MSEGTAEQRTMPPHGAFCWTEISTRNTSDVKNFYKEIFGWNFYEGDVADSPVPYLEFGIGDTRTGGMYEPTAEMSGGVIPPPHFMNYIAVDDVDESASKAFELGGKIVMPPMDIPNVGRFCIVEDPTGAKFSMITLEEKHNG